MKNILVGIVVLLGACLLASLASLMVALVIFTAGNDRWIMGGMCVFALAGLAAAVGRLWRGRP